MKPGARPPKVLADLFEAVVGVVFLQDRLLALDNWLRTTPQPVLSAATKDHRYYATRTLAFYRDHRTPTFSSASSLQQSIVDYISSERGSSEDRLSSVLYTLPKNTTFHFDEYEYLEEPNNERLEVAAHLFNLSICRTIIRIGYANAKAVHPCSALTGMGRFVFSRNVHSRRILLISAARIDFE